MISNYYKNQEKVQSLERGNSDHPLQFSHKKCYYPCLQSPSNVAYACQKCDTHGHHDVCQFTYDHSQHEGKHLKNLPDSKVCLEFFLKDINSLTIDGNEDDTPTDMDAPVTESTYEIQVLTEATMLSNVYAYFPENGIPTPTEPGNGIVIVPTPTIPMTEMNTEPVIELTDTKETKSPVIEEVDDQVTESTDETKLELMNVIMSSNVHGSKDTLSVSTIMHSEHKTPIHVSYLDKYKSNGGIGVEKMDIICNSFEKYIYKIIRRNPSKVTHDEALIQIDQDFEKFKERVKNIDAKTSIYPIAISQLSVSKSSIEKLLNGGWIDDDLMEVIVHVSNHILKEKEKNRNQLLSLVVMVA